MMDDEIVYEGGFREGDLVQIVSDWRPDEYGLVTWRAIRDAEEYPEWSSEDVDEYVPIISTHRSPGGYDPETWQVVDHIPAMANPKVKFWIANVCPRCERKEKLEGDYLCEDCRLGK